MGVGFPEFGRTIDESSKSWRVKIDLIEERYLHVVELRGVDDGYEVL
jgi:hypothetical protein